MKTQTHEIHVLDRGIPFHLKLLDYGERPYWTPDGKKIAFIAKNYGDAELIDVMTRTVTPLTAQFGAAGPHSFLRVLVMCTGDYILIGPEVFEDRSVSRWKKSELWFLDRELKRPPQRLGRRLFEGIALSWVRPLLSYAQTDQQDPVLKGTSIVRMAGIEVTDGLAGLVNDRTVITVRGGYCLEPQDFRHDDTEILSSGYKKVDGKMHGIVHGLRLADGRETIYCNEPGVYNEPEGIFPDNDHICLECGTDGFPPRDLWKMKLDPSTSLGAGGSGERVRMTRMIDHLPWRATNSNVSPDGRWLAFMVNKDTDEYGYGRGLGLLDLEAWGRHPVSREWRRPGR
jgi:hypothetical protein